MEQVHFAFQCIARRFRPTIINNAQRGAVRRAKDFAGVKAALSDGVETSVGVRHGLRWNASLDCCFDGENLGVTSLEHRLVCVYISISRVIVLGDAQFRVEVAERGRLGW